MFDEPTRTAIQQNLVEFGDALAGRGPRSNAALGAAAAAARRLEPVARNLASTETGLARSSARSRTSAAEVAPVAETQAQMFVALDTTFGALARSPARSSRTRSPRPRRRFDTLIRTVAADQDLPRPQRHAVRRPAAGGPRAERELADDRLGARDRCARSCPTLRAQRPARAHRPDARGVRDGPRRAGRDLALDPDSSNFLTPTLRFVDPGAVGLQLRDAPVPQRAEPVQHRRRDRRPGSGSSSCRAARSTQRRDERRTARTARHRRRRTDQPGGLDHSELPPLNPYPNTASPGQPHVVRGRQRELHREQGRDREPAGQSGHQTRTRPERQNGG